MSLTAPGSNEPTGLADCDGSTVGEAEVDGPGVVGVVGEVGVGALGSVGLADGLAAVGWLVGDSVGPIGLDVGRAVEQATSVAQIRPTAMARLDPGIV